MILDSSLTLEGVLSGAVSANQPEFHVDYIVWNNGNAQPGIGGEQPVQQVEQKPKPATLRGALNSTTDVTLISPTTGRYSTQGFVAEVLRLTIYNKDTASVTATVKTTDGSTDRIKWKSDLATGETLVYANGVFREYTSDGKLKTGDSGGIFTIVAPTSFPSANSVDITDIPQTYSSLVLVVNGASSDTATRAVRIRVSTDNGSNFATTGIYGNSIQNTTVVASSNTGSLVEPSTQTAAQTTSFVLVITGYQSGPYTKSESSGFYADSTAFSDSRAYINTGGVNALRITWNDTGNFDAGSYSLYGVS